MRLHSPFVGGGMGAYKENWVITALALPNHPHLLLRIDSHALAFRFYAICHMGLYEFEHKLILVNAIKTSAGLPGTALLFHFEGLLALQAAISA